MILILFKDDILVIQAQILLVCCILKITQVVRFYYSLIIMDLYKPLTITIKAYDSLISLIIHFLYNWSQHI